MTPNDVVIRKATFDDIEQIKPLFIELQNIHSDNYPDIFKHIDTISHDYLIEEIKTYSYYYVAIINDLIIGYLKGINRVVNETYIIKKRNMLTLVDLIILKEYRKKGIAHKMLEYIEDLAIANGIESIEIPVYEFNKEAISFYNKNGYKKYVEREVKVFGE